MSLSITDTSAIFQCKFCTEKFQSHQGLESHRKKIHEIKRNYPCQDCDKVFHYITNLKQHQRIHDGSTPFSCNFCPKAFNQKVLLETHMNKLHFEKGLYECSLCTKNFSNARGFRRHTVFDHREIYLDNDTKTVCNLCWHIFHSEPELEDHIVSVHHKHKCTVCQKQFKERGHLQEHLHLHLDVLPFKCELCPDSKGFRRKAQLKRHINDKHSKVLVIE